MAHAHCPQCDQLALIADRRTLYSTDGPLEYVRLDCPAGHWFTLPAADLRMPAAVAA